ncbi:hypothetical protein TeGR_g15240 [Tetraparma gracilis]|uniref:Uncharacterized protein n=1 Tax=Tetraparma gracilis TaxID=2962635 RepID=A0ABQ6MQZ8_9STRA|nr:hypothetical protein TeGR_g15240 [Tetraparma gracilis]
MTIPPSTPPNAPSTSSLSPSLSNSNPDSSSNQPAHGGTPSSSKKRYSPRDSRLRILANSSRSSLPSSPPASRLVGSKSKSPSLTSPLATRASPPGSLHPKAHRGTGGKDTSFLKDTGNKLGLQSKIPPSLVPASQAVTATSMFPPDDPKVETRYDPDTGMWENKIFPAMHPSGRQDVELLDKWLTDSLAGLGVLEEMSVQSRSATVREQLNVLMIGFRELVRQVSTQCTQRGMLLDKIWKAMSSLLDFVVGEMQSTIVGCEQRMNDLNLRAGRHESDMLDMKSRHDSEIKVLTQSIGHKWGKRVETLKQALLEKEYELQNNLETVTLLQRWFPSFLNYAGTVMNDMLPRDADDDRNDVDLMVALPEEALMDDLDRVVQHCLMDTKLVKVDEEEEAGGEGGEGGDDLDDALGSEAKLAGRLADMLKGEEGGGAGAGGAGGGAGGGQQYEMQRRITRGNERNEIVFRNLMSASREYQNEIVKLQYSVEQLEIENENLRKKEEQEMKAMRKREAMLHHLVLASTLTFPLEPVVLPLHGRASMAVTQGASNQGGLEAGNSRFDTAQDTKIVNAARTQRDCVRYIKQYAEFEAERQEALLTTTNLPNSNTWWMLKQSFHQFVKQQVMMKNPDDFHLAEKNCRTLERSCMHWATHHNDEGGRRQMAMFSKLLRSSKLVYTPRQESLWLFLSNQLHSNFKFAFDDTKSTLPVSLVPTNKAQIALKLALLNSEEGKGGLQETNWRKLPENLVTAAVDKIYKASGDYEGLHIEIFTLIDIAIDFMSRYENELKQALIHLSNVASGVDEMDSVNWAEFNTIIDIVEPNLVHSMRLTLFHRFSVAATRKEGKKWESQALAEVLLQYALPMDRLYVVYVGVGKQIKLHLEAQHDACIKHTMAVIDHLITSTVDDDDVASIRELEARLAQVKDLTAEALATKEKSRIESAYLACLFLEQETKKVKEAHMHREGGGGVNTGAGFSSVLSSAIKFDAHFLLKSKFGVWKRWTEEVRAPNRRKTLGGGGGGGGE